MGKISLSAILGIGMLYDDRTNEIIVNDPALHQCTMERVFGFLHECGHIFHANMNSVLRGSKFQELVLSKVPSEQMNGCVYSAVAEGIAQYLAVTMAFHGDLRLLEAASEKRLRLAASVEHQEWMTIAREHDQQISDDALLHQLLYNFDHRCSIGYKFVRRICPTLEELKKIILRPPETVDELRNPAAYYARLGI